ncbi:MAG TPA: prephenate dehydratase [Polyangia bacterium]|nr:prephenate dehydratase [Polyangia bacterium]
MTTKLPELRQAIDELDDKLLELLNERARLVQEVGQIKAQLKQPFYVPERERQILERLQAANSGPFPTEALRPVFSEIISACLSLEHPLRVAFLGPEATFTHMAARSRFGLSARYVPAATVAGVFAEVEKGVADLGVVPIENSTEGVVNSTLDVLIDSELCITAEIATTVSHCLLTRSGTLEGVQKVYSHPQALAQCRQWLSANLSNVAQIEVASTALAARLTRDDPVAAAVASELAGQLYDLKIARKKIEDEVRNVTRFLVIGRQAAPATGRDKTSILFSLKDEAGVLFKVLQPLADAGLNLSRIESRPSRKKLWDYVFFIDVDGHASEPAVKAAIAALEERCQFVKVLGSYPRAGTPEEP